MTTSEAPIIPLHRRLLRRLLTLRHYERNSRSSFQEPLHNAACRRPLPGLVLALVGGIVYGLQFYGGVLALSSFFSTVPWLLLILRPCGWKNFTWFLLTVYVSLLIGAGWLIHFSVASWLCAPLLFMPLFIPLFGLTKAVRYWWPTWPLAVLWPLTFTGTEWLRVQGSPGSLSFCQLGLSVVDFQKLLQIADIGGVSGLSFLLAASSGATVEALLWLRRPNLSRGRSVLRQCLVVLLLYGFALAYGFVRDTEVTFKLGAEMMVVQPGMPALRDAANAEKKLTALLDMTATHADLHPKMIVWPENAIMDTYLIDGRPDQLHTPRVQSMAASIGVPILIDGPSRGPAGQERHTATLICPDGTMQFYDKVQLIPWSEYVPLEGLFAAMGERPSKAYVGFIMSFNPRVSRTEAGAAGNVKPFVFGEGKSLQYFGTPICFEIGSAGLMQKWHSGLKPADFILNPTNEALLGRGVGRHTLAIARFRAVEGRVTIVRAANDRGSARIDPNGRVVSFRGVSQLGEAGSEAGVFYTHIILDSRRGTIYTRFGDVLPLGCLSLSLLCVVGGICRRSRRTSS